MHQQRSVINKGQLTAPPKPNTAHKEPRNCSALITTHICFSFFFLCGPAAFIPLQNNRSSRKLGKALVCLGRVKTFQGGKQTRVRVAKLMSGHYEKQRLESIGKQRAG